MEFLDICSDYARRDYIRNVSSEKVLFSVAIPRTHCKMTQNIISCGLPLIAFPPPDVCLPWVFSWYVILPHTVSDSSSSHSRHVLEPSFPVPRGTLGAPDISQHFLALLIPVWMDDVSNRITEDRAFSFFFYSRDILLRLDFKEIANFHSFLEEPQSVEVRGQPERINFLLASHRVVGSIEVIGLGSRHLHYLNQLSCPEFCDLFLIVCLCPLESSFP